MARQIIMDSIWNELERMLRDYGCTDGKMTEI